ncbi:zinc finger MYM-type protein 1-like protein [Tanacetum coccineum]
MALVLRYVDKLGIVKERFAGVVHVDDTSSATLKASIDTLFAPNGAHFRGHKFIVEGSSNKRSKYIGSRFMLKMDEACAAKRNRIVGITNRHYFEIDIFNTVLDMQIQEFGDRSSEISTHLLSYMSALSPRASFSMFDASKLINLTTLYPDDFTDSDRFHLMRELDLYHVNVVQNEDFSKLNIITELAKELVRLDKHKSFPMIYKLLKLALVLPVATATVEICFSTIKLINSDIRNRIGNRFLG